MRIFDGILRCWNERGFINKHKSSTWRCFSQGYYMAGRDHIHVDFLPRRNISRYTLTNMLRSLICFNHTITAFGSQHGVGNSRDLGVFLSFFSKGQSISSLPATDITFMFIPNVVFRLYFLVLHTRMVNKGPFLDFQRSMLFWL